MLAELDEAVKSEKPSAAWDIARVYWNIFLQPSSITAIDFHGTERALKLDLNSPLDMKRKFHIINNCGTLEHIFNIGQAFKWESPRFHGRPKSAAHRRETSARCN